VVRHSGVQPAKGCAAAPAILIRTTVLRPVSQPRLLATKVGGELALRSEQALPAMGYAAAPAILIRTTVLRPVSQPRLLATGIVVKGFS
jgi:hypothetical protein